MLRPLPLRLAGTGTALPARIVTNAELEERMRLPTGWIERRAGVRERRWAGPGETNSVLGARAGRAALAEAGWAPGEVEMVLYASGTPEQAIPDTAPLIQRELGLGESGIACHSVHATCLSFLAALLTAATHGAAGLARRVLIVSAEVGSPALDFSQPEAAALFGDMAAAAAVEIPAGDEGPALLASRWETYGVGADFAELPGCGSRRHPARAESRSEDQLFRMNGIAAARLVRRRMPDFLERLRPGLSRGLAEVDLVIPHQASRLGMDLMREWGWPAESIVRTLEEHGNCIAASLPLTLHAARAAGRLRSGAEALLIGSGAGLSLAGVIWRV